MAPRITIIGGGSYQWVPKLIVDLANSPVLREAEIVIEDIDPAPVPKMVELVEHIAKVANVPLTARGTTDQREALEGADYVVVNISTGGFESMRHDLEIPERYGIFQSVGDSVGPGGIIRAQRNIPVFLDIARDMEAVCPDAWLLNLTNPMTTICRSVTRSSSITTIGLCHEITLLQFVMSLLLDVGFMDITATVAGVNHLPFVTKLDVKGEDGFAMLRDLIEHADTRGNEVLDTEYVEGLGHEKISEGGEWTKADLLHHNQLKLELFRTLRRAPGRGRPPRRRVLPRLPDRGVGLGEPLGNRAHEHRGARAPPAGAHRRLREDARVTEVSQMPSGEMVAPVITCRMLDQPGWFPLNIPNNGQVADLPSDVTVESMCVADGSGVRGRDEVSLPGAMREQLRRVSASQELTVEAAISGNRDTVLEAMLADPLAGRIDYDALGA